MYVFFGIMYVFLGMSILFTMKSRHRYFDCTTLVSLYIGHDLAMYLCFCCLRCRRG
jgi:hypothetical protein